jgi:hypothetical protein
MARHIGVWGPCSPCWRWLRGISLSLNIAFGLQTSILAALVFALSDCAKIMLPMVSAAFGRWDLRGAWPGAWPSRFR